MFEYIKGEIRDLKPAYVIVENNDIGYFINISLNSYSKINGLKEAQVFIHHVIREDSHTLFGFADKKERELFRYLISVSGIGANTARMMLSSMLPEEIQNAITTGNVALLKGIKGIGAKTAQRVIVDLSDKLGKFDESDNIFVEKHNTIKEEALSALVMLGFSKKAVEKTVNSIMQGAESQSLESIVKEALKIL
jgi:Holliday junction DNA helicase RuvA